MKLALAIGLALSILAGFSHAQESLVGKYSGGFKAKTNQGEQWATVVLEILSVEGGRVKAKAVRGAYANIGVGLTCAGEYQLEGTYENNKLLLKSVAGPGAGDCRLGFMLVVEGNKLKGRLNKNDLELSK
jgi:hypothetical protein